MNKYLIALMLLLCVCSCKKADDTTIDKNKLLATQNAQLKGAWTIASGSSVYYSATTDEQLLTPEISRYNYSFDGQTSMVLAGQVSTIPNLATTYILTYEDNNTYLNFADETGAKRQMQIVSIGAEMKLRETVTYSPAVAYAGRKNSKGETFQYNKRVLDYTCVKQ